MKNKIKVLHITHTSVYEDSRILKEIEALSDTNLYEVYSIGVAAKKGGAKTLNKVVGKVKTLALISKKFTFLPTFLRHALNLIELFVSMIFFGVRYRPKVIHCHDTIVLPIGIVISFVSGAKVIYDAHELESNKNGQTKFNSSLTLLIERICWPRIDTLISVSPSILNWYDEELGYKKNTLILNSPVISNNSKKEGSKYFHSIYNIPDNELIFIYLGNLGQGRGIELLLNVFNENKIKSHIIFMGYGDLESEIISFTKKTNHIHLHPQVPHENVVNIVKSADFGMCIIENVSLSDYYCLPNKLFEYAFAGLPVLASNFPDILDLVSRHELGICSDVNEVSVISAIQTLEETNTSYNPKNIEELKWDSQAKRLIKAYNAIQKNEAF